MTTSCLIFNYKKALFWETWGSLPASNTERTIRASPTITHAVITTFSPKIAE